MTEVKRSLLLGGIVGAALLLIQACHLQPLRSAVVCTDLVPKWGVPSDVCTIQRQLTALRLPDTVESLGWLRAERLRELNVDGAVGLTRVAALPPSLRSLSLKGAGVTSLSVPSCLQTLDITDTALESLRDVLPFGLRDLSLSEVRPSQLQYLPRSLETLHLTQTNPTRQLADLSFLEDLERLRTLVLTGQEILSLEGIPPGVESLAVELGRLKIALLPERLRRLSVTGGNPWVAENMPRRIDGLSLDGWQPDGPLLDSTPFLDGLTAREINLRNLGDLPDSILDLELYGNLKRLPDLPPNLQRLYVSADQLDRDGNDGASDLDGLPESLEDLALFSYPAPTLPPLPPGLRSLDLSWSRVRDLEPLQALPDLRELNLTGVGLGAGSPPLPDVVKKLVWQAYGQAELRELPAMLEILDVRTPPCWSACRRCRRGSGSSASPPRAWWSCRTPPPQLTFLDVSGCESLPASAFPSRRVADPRRVGGPVRYAGGGSGQPDPSRSGLLLIHG